MFISVNGVELYYEKTGQGYPIVLLHGNGESHTIFDVLIKQLSPNYTVYAIDSRDHGKSSNVKSLYYNDMMEDVAAFIRELKIERPVVYGFSDGGIVGILLAIKYPALILKLIVSGANIRPDGIKRITLLLMKITYFFTRSRKHKLMLTQPDITDSELSTIVAPTFVLAGSKDIIKDEHTKSIANNIPGSVLKILEGESHASYVSHSEKLYFAIEPFLADG
ncbi:MAG: alpha/beta hydrolase [Oscillospiraceae bacterium]|nr:alpha/beta hydrolase [Oscillospiraceae bacterium]